MLTFIVPGKERVRSAIKNSGFSFPMARLTVNLAPADVRKEGPAFGLPVALGVLMATSQVAASKPASSPPTPPSSPPAASARRTTPSPTPA